MEKAKEVVVFDASAVVKWFVDEEHTEQALRIRADYRDGKIDPWSTQLMPFEVLNALRYNPELGAQELVRAATALSTYRIALYPILDELKELCVTNALKYGVTIYEAAYLSLSELLHRKFYTADDNLLIKTKDVETIHHVREYEQVGTAPH